MPDALTQICSLTLDTKLQGLLLLPGKEALITNRTFTLKTCTLNDKDAV